MTRRLFIALAGSVASAQVIEFESGGLKYQTLSRNLVTVMFAHLPSHVLDYAIVQVAVSNGAKTVYTVRPEDFTFERTNGPQIPAAPARTVVTALIERGGRGDVVKLVSTYESALYGISRLKPTNGYEARRQQFLAEVASTKIKAAAAASAIAFVQTKLVSGQSTDGAVFFPTEGKPLGAGRLVMRNAAGEFLFDVEEPTEPRR